MKELLIGTGLVVTVFYMYRKHIQQQQSSGGTVYYGAPVWPQMNPIPVPQIALPPGLQQAPNYYGIYSTSLEPYLK